MIHLILNKMTTPKTSASLSFDFTLRTLPMIQNISVLSMLVTFKSSMWEQRVNTLMPLSGTEKQRHSQNTSLVRKGICYFNLCYLYTAECHDTDPPLDKLASVALRHVHMGFPFCRQHSELEPHSHSVNNKLGAEK